MNHVYRANSINIKCFKLVKESIIYAAQLVRLREDRVTDRQHSTVVA